MTTDAITPETAALLALIHPADGDDHTPHTAALHDALEGVHVAIALCSARVADIQKARRDAIRAPAPAHEQQYFEMVNQTCKALAREVEAMASALDNAVVSSRQMDSYAITIMQNLLKRAAAAADTGAP